MWIKTKRGQLVDITGKCLTIDAGALVASPGNVKLTDWGDKVAAREGMDRIERAILNRGILCDLSKGEHDV